MLQNSLSISLSFFFFTFTQQAEAQRGKEIHILQMLRRNINNKQKKGLTDENAYEEIPSSLTLFLPLFVTLFIFFLFMLKGHIQLLCSFFLCTSYLLLFPLPFLFLLFLCESNIDSFFVRQRERECVLSNHMHLSPYLASVCVVLSLAALMNQHQWLISCVEMEIIWLNN